MLGVADQARYNLIFVKSMLRSGNRLTSDSVIHAAIQYYGNRNDSTRLHQALSYKGLFHYLNAMHDSAVFFFDKAIEAVPREGHSDIKAYYKRLSGYSHLYLGNTQEAVSSQKEALQYARDSNDSLTVIYSLLALAEVYNRNKETEQSLETFLLALDRIRESGNRDMEANILNVVSGIYESDNRIKDALVYKNISQEIRRKREDVPTVNLHRAILYGKLNMPDSAQYYAQLAIKGNNTFIAGLAYTFLSITEEKRGHSIDALNFSKNSERIFDTFLSGTRSLEMEQKYEKEKLENENNRLKIKQKEHQVYLMAGLFLLLLMLIGFYVIRVYNKQKNEKTAHENKMYCLHQENLLLKQQQEISALREKETALRESLFRKINFFHKLPSLSKEENNSNSGNGRIIITADDWQELNYGIRNAYPGFIDKLKQHAPTLSEDDVNFCSLLKINVNIQDLSDIYCISKAAVTKRKYRLKTDKFHITDNNINLDAVLKQIY